MASGVWCVGVACVTYACPKGRPAIVIYDSNTHTQTKGGGHMKNLCKLQAENKGQAKSAGCLPKKKSCRLLAANPWAPSACGVHPSVLITVWLPCCASCESLCVSASLCSGCFSICVCLFAYLHLH